MHNLIQISFYFLHHIKLLLIYHTQETNGEGQQLVIIITIIF